MAASVFPDRMLREPLQSMADQIDAEMEKEERGQTTSTECLANADCAPQLVTVVCSHSRIADVDITVAQEHGVVVHGVQLLQITPGADVGDTAGVEELQQPELPEEL